MRELIRRLRRQKTRIVVLKTIIRIDDDHASAAIFHAWNRLQQMRKYLELAHHFLPQKVRPTKGDKHLDPRFGEKITYGVTERLDMSVDWKRVGLFVPKRRVVRKGLDRVLGKIEIGISNGPIRQK